MSLLIPAVIIRVKRRQILFRAFGFWGNDLCLGFGVLLLDGEICLSETSDFVYMEAMV